MTSSRPALVAITILLAVAGAAPVHTQTPPARAAQADELAPVLRRLEAIVRAGDAPGLIAMAEPRDQKRVRDFIAFDLLPGATRAVVLERDRMPLQGVKAGDGYRLHVDAFIEFGDRARAATWRLDLKRNAEGWRLADQERITATENLYRLSLNPAKQYDARDLVISAEDVEFRLVSGSVFVSEIDQGVTGLVLMGNGELRFHPRPDTEKGQVRIFCGAETLNARFDAAFIRLNPGDFELRVDPTRLTARAVDPRAFRRADELFQQEVPNSFGLDLGDLSRDNWSLLPAFGDMLADVHTKKYDTLTYAKSAAEPEDITLFDRRHRHNIALYASQEKLAARGPFYNEDDLEDYDVTDYDIDVAVAPDRAWLQGRATLVLTVKAASLNALTIKLADTLAVQSLVATGFGRLFPIRVRNQNMVVVNLLAPVKRGAQLMLAIAYGGRLETQPPDSETLQVGRPPAQEDVPVVAPEVKFLYSNRSFWYPQGQYTDYANARLRVTVPALYDCVASGDPAPGYPMAAAPNGDPAHAQKVYLFNAIQPVRYLAFVVSRFMRSDAVTVPVPAPLRPSAADDPSLVGVSYETLSVNVAANPRQMQRGRQLLDRAIGIAKFYASLVGDAPYPTFTLAVVEDNLPGGHSPGYFAMLNQPLPTSPYVWRNDPASFPSYPDFFIAHEVAHQWWGQAVGWRNYHEQWLSEGFAQYFAALYAERQRGPEVFADLMRQARRWTFEERDQGPIYLGYRLGHIRNDGRVFRALVYDKSAAVLQMLRRLVGDEPFFRGIQRFYRSSRFRKAGTDDFRLAMEHECGCQLARFFDRWVYGSALPRLKFGYHVVAGEGGQEAVLRVEQLGDVLFDVPVPVRLELADGRRLDVVIPVTDRTAELRVPLTAKLKDVEVRDDDGMLAEIVR